MENENQQENLDGKKQLYILQNARVIASNKSVAGKVFPHTGTFTLDQLTKGVADANMFLGEFETGTEGYALLGLDINLAYDETAKKCMQTAIQYLPQLDDLEAHRMVDHLTYRAISEIGVKQKRLPVLEEVVSEGMDAMIDALKNNDSSVLSFLLNLEDGLDYLQSKGRTSNTLKQKSRIIARLLLQPEHLKINDPYSRKLGLAKSFAAFPEDKDLYKQIADSYFSKSLFADALQLYRKIDDISGIRKVADAAYNGFAKSTKMSEAMSLFYASLGARNQLELHASQDERKIALQQAHIFVADPNEHFMNYTFIKDLLVYANDKNALNEFSEMMYKDEKNRYRHGSDWSSRIKIVQEVSQITCNEKWFKKMVNMK